MIPSEDMGEYESGDPNRRRSAPPQSKVTKIQITIRSKKTLKKIIKTIRYINIHSIHSHLVEDCIHWMKKVLMVHHPDNQECHQRHQLQELESENQKFIQVMQWIPVVRHTEKL